MAIPKDSLHQELLALLQNEEITENLRSCKSPEECYDVAKSFVPGVSLSEFTESMKLIRAYVEESKDGLISDSELENVAGGANNTTTILIGGGIAAAAAAAV